MANWCEISRLIFDFIDLEEEKRPSYNRVTIQSAKYFNIDRTLFREFPNGEYNDQLWIYEDEELAMVLFKVFHECWHAKQKSLGRIIKYTEEDKQKYVGKSHMMMIYKYDFEAEASGYAAAFVYEIYKFGVMVNKDYLGKVIEDKYDNVDYYPENEFDSHDDYININNKIKKYYYLGKEYFLKQMLNSVSEEMKELFESLDDNTKVKMKYFSSKGMILSSINEQLK